MMPRLLIAALAVTFLVSGCTPSTPAAKPSPVASATPLFATDEEALAAATAAYAAYLKMSDTILQEGGANPERIKSVASSALANSEIEGFNSFNKDGYRSTGQTTFNSLALEDPTATKELVAYACADVSGVDVVNGEGISVVTESRPDRTPFELKFRQRGTTGLILQAKGVWDGGGVCQ